MHARMRGDQVLATLYHYLSKSGQETLIKFELIATATHAAASPSGVEVTMDGNKIWVDMVEQLC